MLYDYNGFAEYFYTLTYPAPGESTLAKTVQGLLHAQGIPAQLDEDRGFDHGTFVPLMLMYPKADIPVVQLCLDGSLDPTLHIRMGKAIAGLRKQGVLIIGSGLSIHNMKLFLSSDQAAIEKAEVFDDWLIETLTTGEHPTTEQKDRLTDWESAPGARHAHPREEHLLPLHVCLGAASILSAKAEHEFHDTVLGVRTSGFCWR